MSIDEKWLEGLTEQNKKRILRKFQNEKDELNKQNLLNELAVVQLLFKSGIENIRYEQKNFGVQTPDWLVFKDNSELDFIIEVFSLNTQEKVKQAEEFIENLTSEINKLDINVKLNLEIDIDIDYENFKNSKPLKIKNELFDWLETHPDEKEYIKIDICKFSIIEYINEGSSIIILRNYGIRYDSQPYRSVNILFQKIKRYKKLIENTHSPFVVAIYDTFFSRAKPEEIVNIVFQQKFIVKDYLKNKYFLKENPLLKNDFIKLISGILIIEYINKIWSIYYIDNSYYSKFKIDDLKFDKIIEFNGLSDEKIAIIKQPIMSVTKMNEKELGSK